MSRAGDKRLQHDGRGVDLRDAHFEQAKRRRTVVRELATAMDAHGKAPLLGEDVAPIGPQRYSNALEGGPIRPRASSDAVSPVGGVLRRVHPSYPCPNLPSCSCPC